MVGQGLYYGLHVGVVLEVLDGQPAGGVVGADIVVFLNQQLDAVDAAFELLSVVDVDVAGQSRLVVLVNLDNCVKQPVDALSAAADGGHHRHAEQMSEGDGVEPVSAGLQLVVHVHGHDHAEVHVDDLGRQVEIALEVGGVHHVDDHVGNIVDQILAYVQLLRAVG